jgi:hypothetical protein
MAAEGIGLVLQMDLRYHTFTWSNGRRRINNRPQNSPPKLDD